MNISKLNKRITVYKETEGIDDFGGVTKEKEVIGDFWANVKPVSMEEKNSNDRLKAKLKVIFTLRYSKLIDNTSLIEYNGESYEVFSVIDENERHSKLILEAVKL